MDRQNIFCLLFFQATCSHTERRTILLAHLFRSRSTSARIFRRRNNGRHRSHWYGGMKQSFYKNSKRSSKRYNLLYIFSYWKIEVVAAASVMADGRVSSGTAEVEISGNRTFNDSASTGLDGVTAIRAACRSRS